MVQTIGFALVSYHRAFDAHEWDNPGTFGNVAILQFGLGSGSLLLAGTWGRTVPIGCLAVQYGDRLAGSCGTGVLDARRDPRTALGRARQRGKLCAQGSIHGFGGDHGTSGAGSLLGGRLRLAIAEAVDPLMRGAIPLVHLGLLLRLPASGAARRQVLLWIALWHGVVHF
jgi:hypothetical protein